MELKKRMTRFLCLVIIGIMTAATPVSAARTESNLAGIAAIATTEQITAKARSIQKDNPDESDKKRIKKIAKKKKASRKKKIIEEKVDRQALVQFALSFVGKIPYVYGGNSLETGVDCSGFVQQIFKCYGISLPRTSGEQGRSGRAITFSEIQPGDLIYYGGHISIYIGNNQVVHASNRKTGIKVSQWDYRYVICIRNVID